MKKWENGITLIALVITIIVLLILVGVTIATLTGDNGLLQKATTAKQENEDSKELELIKLAVSAAQVAGNGILTTENLNNEIKNIFGEEGIFIETSLAWKYKKNNNYKIYENGKVEKLLLPVEYQQIDYIKSTGTQFINTEVYPKSTTKVVFDFSINEAGGKNGWCSAEYNEAFTWGSSSNKYTYGINHNSEGKSIDMDLDSNRHSLLLCNENISLDGTKYGEGSIGNTATNKQFLYLCATHCEWKNRPGYYSGRSRLLL